MRTLELSAISASLDGEPAEEPSFVERIQQADVAAIAAVYDGHHAPLCAFARRLLSDDAAAEDLVHDVFLILPRLIGNLEKGRSLRSFLLGVAANRARHHYRARRRFFRMAARLSREPRTQPDRPDHSSERSSVCRAVARALDTLSLDHRVTFVLCELEERSSREAAEILGVPEGTVRTRLFHAKHKLRIALAKEGLP
jgi:RNA polymerase sigma-70 factor, ECF subfamily